jgi:hypothetical protein
MNLPIPQTSATPESRPVISTYSILLLSGMLFGICVSGSVSSDLKGWVILTGTLGLVAYVVASFAAHKQKQAQVRLAAMQIEERLERHSHHDLRAEDLRLESANGAAKLA